MYNILNPDDIFLCQVVCKMFYVSVSAEKMEDKKIDLYVCAACFKQFDTEDSLTSHLMSCEEKVVVKNEKEFRDQNEVMNQASSCSEERPNDIEMTFVKTEPEFSKESGLTNNILRQNDENLSSPLNEGGIKTEMSEDNEMMDQDSAPNEDNYGKEKPDYTCHVCRKVLRNNSTYHVHVRTHTGEKPHKCDQCDKTFQTMSSLNRHLRIHNGEKCYQCDVCDKAFSQKHVLDKHYRTHTGAKPYKCEVCDKTYTREDYFKEHMQKHTDERQFQCDLCNKTFSRKAYLNEHKLRHSAEKSYQCDQCDKTFLFKVSLNRHYRTHTGDIPHQCEFCDKAFIQKHTLTIHTRRMHTGERPYKCDQCDQSFADKTDCNVHQRKHSGKKLYQCDQCDKAYSDKAALNIHCIAHIGETPFQCDMCDKTFSLRSVLDSLYVIHTGEKPYQCKICNKGYADKRDLDRHILTIHLGIHNKPYRCGLCDKSFRTQYPIGTVKMEDGATSVLDADNTPGELSGEKKPIVKSEPCEMAEYTFKPYGEETSKEVAGEKTGSTVQTTYPEPLFVVKVEPN